LANRVIMTNVDANRTAQLNSL